MKRKIWKQGTAVLWILLLSAGLATGCAGTPGPAQDSENAAAGQERPEEKVFYYVDTTFNAENDEKDVNPHKGYSGWSNGSGKSCENFEL